LLIALSLNTKCYGKFCRKAKNLPANKQGLKEEERKEATTEKDNDKKIGAWNFWLNELYTLFTTSFLAVSGSEFAGEKSVNCAVDI